MNEPESKPVLHCLENEKLSAASFIRDYVQLHFDGPCLNAYVCPHILHQKESITPKVSGYRDALCERIGKIVVKASEELGERLVIVFADDVTLAVSLKETDRDGPEAAMFHDHSGKSWNVW